MGSVARHFVLGVVIGIISIMMLYVMFSSVVISKDQLNVGAEIIVILSYGVVTAILGEILVKVFKNKK